MSLLPGGMQISGGLALINLSAKFSDSGSALRVEVTMGVMLAASRRFRTSIL